MSTSSDRKERWHAAAQCIPSHVETLAASYDDGIAIALLWKHAGGRNAIAVESNHARAASLHGRFNTVVPVESQIGENVDALVAGPESDAEWASLSRVVAAMPPNAWLLLLVPRERNAVEIAEEIRCDLLYERQLRDSLYVFAVMHAPTYDRLVHATDLMEAGRPAHAFDILAVAEAGAQELSRLSLMHEALLSWEKKADDSGQLDRFFLAQSLFGRILDKDSLSKPLFQTQARFWERIGDSEMARRFERTIAYATSSGVEHPESADIVVSQERELPPYDESYKPRVLMILESEPDYGADVLYDGLVEVLGPENVVDFPWKPSLHGHNPTQHAQYPCVFDHASESVALHDILEQLKGDQFDTIVYAAYRNALNKDDLHAITTSAPRLPVYLLDQGDSPANLRQAMATHIGVPNHTPYFKREMLCCADYGPNAYPMPFAYPNRRVFSGASERTEPIFWAGHRAFGLRRLYLEHIERRLGISLATQLAQDEYAAAMQRARVGLSFFGLGFDTVRYWELPAHGCMLLSERLPIRVPHNFVDGESAVFFDDLEELERRLMYYLERPEEAERIARAGHAHFERYHTGAARARQLLAHMQSASKPA